MHAFVFVLGIIFLTVVAPLWIIFHYITIWRASRRLSSGDEKALGELWQSARRMEEAPGWRMRAGG